MFQKWFSGWRTSEILPYTVGRRRGFAEASGGFAALQPAKEGFGRPPAWARTVEPANRDEGNAAPFASTGPAGHRARMRDKVRDRGTDALADYELLEMLLFLAFKAGDTKPLAKALINRFGSFAAVLAAPYEQLIEVRGLGPHSVTALQIVRAAAVRMTLAEVREQPILNSPEKLVGYLTMVLAREKVEQFRVLFLNPRNRLIADEAQGRGTVDHTPVCPREIVKRALELHATAIILVHNHPSGDPSPSVEDVAMTREIREAGRLLSVRVHDHIIVGNGASFSFRELGLLN